MSNPTHGTDLQSAEAEKMTDYDSDRKLVQKAQAGDVSAFGDLVDKHQKSVYGIVSRMVKNRDDVDDLVQDIFVASYDNISKFRGEAKFSTWLHSITVNMTLKRMKSIKRKQAASIDDPDAGLMAILQAEDSPSPAESAEQKERDEAVRNALDLLPEKQRIVIVMHYFEQYTCEEIAQVLKCSVGTVWSRLHYACKQLKKELRWLEQVASL